tara:strand:+ start:69 stop:722 length:654 start_codon:yes stop_codon:yes gene_type:complete
MTETDEICAIVSTLGNMKKVDLEDLGDDFRERLYWVLPIVNPDPILKFEYPFKSSEAALKLIETQCPFIDNITIRSERPIGDDSLWKIEVGAKASINDGEILNFLVDAESHTLAVALCLAVCKCKLEISKMVSKQRLQKIEQVGLEIVWHGGQPKDSLEELVKNKLHDLISDGLYEYRALIPKGVYEEPADEEPLFWLWFEDKDDRIHVEINLDWND